MKELIRFGLVGLINTFAGLCVIYLLMAVQVNAYAANLIGYAVGLTLSFSLNRRWTFRSNHKLDIRLLSRFTIAVAVSYLANLGVVHAVIQSLRNEYLAQLLGLPTYTIFFYIFCKFFVFRQQVVRR